MKYHYTVLPRPAHLGGGWNLKLFEGDVEVGGGVFPLAWADEPEQGVAWWDEMTEEFRAHWLSVAGVKTPSDAWQAYLTEEAQGDAIAEGEDWLATRKPQTVD